MSKCTPIVLVNPPAEVPRESYDTPDYPAMGIAYVASYLLKTGIDVKIIDSKLERKTLQQTINEIISLRPKILALSSFTHTIVATNKIAYAVKNVLPDTITVVGGYHVSFLPERSLKEFPSFDFLVVGEGEIAFGRLVQALLNGHDYKEIPGVAFRKDGSCCVNGRGEIPDTLDELGIPAWEAFHGNSMRKYAKRLPIMSQRGCPFHCNFCSRPYGNKVRARSIDHVIAEIERNLKEFNCREMMFYDETFTVNKKYVYELCDKIIKKGLNIFKWSATVHANTIDLELLEIMKQAGCTELGLGGESGDPDIIASMQKGITREKVIRAAKLIKKSGISLSVYFIFGHPNETMAKCKETIRMAIKMNPDIPIFGIMVPYPGTQVWEMAIRGEGGYKSISQDWNDYNKQISNAVELENLSRNTLKRIQLTAYAKVYLYNFRWKELFQVIYTHRKRLYYKIWQIVTSLFVSGRYADNHSKNSTVPNNEGSLAVKKIAGI